MSVGLFLGIKNSYVDTAQNIALNYISEINKSLFNFGINRYIEPENIPNVYTNNFFGKSALDHHSAECLRKLAKFAESKIESKHLKLLAINPYRVVFLPIEIEFSFMTQHKEKFWGGEEIHLNAGSSFGLLNELTIIANELGIGLEEKIINKEHLSRINNVEMFEGDDDFEKTENLRSPWLLMYEGARLSIENKIALSLAG